MAPIDAHMTWSRGPERLEATTAVGLELGQLKALATARRVAALSAMRQRERSLRQLPRRTQRQPDSDKVNDRATSG